MNREQRQNKELTDRFPFLIPRNRFTGRIPDSYEFEYTELDMMPEGWKKAFGMQMVEELRVLLVQADFLTDYRIYDIKEKWGTLRWDDNFAIPVFQDEHYRLMRKYMDLSEVTCFQCGNPADSKTKWSVPLCNGCMHGSRLRRK